MFVLRNFIPGRYIFPIERGWEGSYSEERDRERFNIEITVRCNNDMKEYKVWVIKKDVTIGALQDDHLISGPDFHFFFCNIYQERVFKKKKSLIFVRGCK